MPRRSGVVWGAGVPFARPRSKITAVRVVVLHNCDFGAGDRADVADVVNAARDVARALAERGCEVSTQAVDDGEAVEAAYHALSRLRQSQPDLVFNLCES